MKKNSKKSIAALFAIFMLVSCNIRHDRLIYAKVVRDCTGTYLQYDNGDHYVCNDEILAGKEKDTYVSVKLEKTEKCQQEEGKAVCMMYHESKGNITINEVK